jgi:PAS domain S-box-containing protein
LYRIYGFDPAEGVPRADRCIEWVHPEDRQKFVQGFEKAIGQKVDAEVEYRIVLPDGTVKQLQGRGHPVLDANGNLVEVVGTTVDITERKRAEDERTRLQQLEADLAHINRVSMLGKLTASIAHEVNEPLSGVVSNGSACLRWLAGGHSVHSERLPVTPDRPPLLRAVAPGARLADRCFFSLLAAMRLVTGGAALYASIQRKEPPRPASPLENPHRNSVL